MSALTLVALRAELSALRLHDLTETNVLSIETRGSSVAFESENLDADSIADLKSDLATTAADLKQAEDERDEWERRCMVLESHAEEMRERGELGNLVLDLRHDVERVQESARDWAKECATMRAELSAIRKRKGVAAGVCAYSNEIRTLLGYISQSPDNRYYRDASELHRKIMETAP